MVSSESAMTDGRPGPDPSAREPLYMQVARLLRDEIISGAVPLGGPMPGENALKARWGIHRQVGSHVVIPVFEIKTAGETARLGGSYCAECEKPIVLVVTGWRHAA